MHTLKTALLMEQLHQAIRDLPPDAPLAGALGSVSAMTPPTLQSIDQYTERQYRRAHDGMRPPWAVGRRKQKL